MPTRLPPPQAGRWPRARLSRESCSDPIHLLRRHRRRQASRSTRADSPKALGDRVSLSAEGTAHLHDQVHEGDKAETYHGLATVQDGHAETALRVGPAENVREAEMPEGLRRGKTEKAERTPEHDAEPPARRRA